MYLYFSNCTLLRLCGGVCAREAAPAVPVTPVAVHARGAPDAVSSGSAETNAPPRPAAPPGFVHTAHGHTGHARRGLGPVLPLPYIRSVPRSRRPLSGFV